MIPNNLPNRD